MSSLHLPSGAEQIQLFASDRFISEAMGRGVGRMTVDAAETDLVIRKARASETIPLGAIALVGPDESHSYATTDLILRGDGSKPDTRPVPALRLRHISNGFPSAEQVSWGELLEEQQQRKSVTFRLGTQPSEPVIARRFYNVAAIAPHSPVNDNEMRGLMQAAGGLLGMIGMRPAGDFVHKLGDRIGDMRQTYDLRTIQHHRPIVLEQR